MLRAWSVAVLLLTVPLAGCADDGTGGALSIDWSEEPSDAATGEDITFSWRLDGLDGEVSATGVVYGESSVSNPSSPDDYDEETARTAPAESPGTYDGSVRIGDDGTYYFRAYVTQGGTHMWTDEVTVEVSTPGLPGDDTPVTVRITEAPGNETSNGTVTVGWELLGVPGEIAHTGFHYAEMSVEDPQTPADYGNHAGITEPAQVPGSYEADVTADPGTYYGRAHAIKNGNHYWSREVSWTVGDNGTGEEGRENFTIEMADTAGLLIFEFVPSELTVSPGDSITFVNVGSVTHTATFDNATLGDSGDVEPGDDWTVTIPDDLPAGDYSFVCIYHEGQGMTGTITVTEGNGTMMRA